MFKYGKDFEELTIKSEDELLTANGMKYLKEYQNDNTDLFCLTNSFESPIPNLWQTHSIKNVK